MRFALDENAAALRDAAAGLLRGEVTADVIRAGWPGGDREPVAAVWRKLCDTGVPGTLVAEADGGLGLDENALVPLLEEIGYSGLPVPAAETIAVAAPLLASRSFDDGGCHSDPQRQTIITACFRGGGGWGGDGTVPFGAVAELFVLREQNSLRLYRRDQLDLEPVASIDGSRALARIRSRQGGGELLTGDPERAWDRGVLGTAALLTGLARRMLDMTVGYVQGREQFGVPVGSFQAIKHALANALVAVEFARPFVLAAAWAQAAGAGDASTLTSGAKVRANEASRLVARTAIQCHGATGYTTEYDLHLFAKRAWALIPSWGDSNWHRARIGTALDGAIGTL